MATTGTPLMNPSRTRGAGSSGVPSEPKGFDDPAIPSWQMPTPVAEFDTLRALLGMAELWVLIQAFTTDNQVRTGRPELTPTWVKLIVLGWGWERFSLNDLVAHISQPEIWKMFRKYANKKRPAWCEPVPLTPPTVAQLKYLHARLNKWGIDKANAASRRTFTQALDTAKTLGYFDETPFSWGTPDPRHFANADGTVFRSPYASNVSDPATGTHMKAGEVTRGVKVVFSSVHDWRRGLRLILDVRHTPAGPNGAPGDEAKEVLDSTLWLRDNLADRLHGLTVDSVLRGKHVCALQERNVHVVNHPPAKANPMAAEEGRFGTGHESKKLKIAVVKHTTPRGKECSHDIYSIGAVFCQRTIDANGDAAFEPLEIKRHETRPNKSGTYRHYQQMSGRCVHGDFTHRFPLFHADLGNKQTGEYVRTYPPKSELFNQVYGWRNDTESLHAQLKRRRTRMPAHGAAAQQISIVLWALWHNAKAVHRARLAIPIAA